MKVIHICPSTQNKGDDFVAIGIKKLFYELIPNIDYRQIAANSKIDFNNFRIGGITKNTIDLLNSSDLIVVGGSNLYETMQIEIEVDSLDKLIKPVILIGIGTGWDFKSPRPPQFSTENEYVIKKLHDKAIGSSVRDKMTKRVLENIGIDNVTVTGCPAALIYNQPLKKAEDQNIYISCLPYRMFEPQSFDPRINLWRASYKRKRAITNSYFKLLKLLDFHKIPFKIFVTDFRDIPIAQKNNHDKEVIVSSEPQELLMRLNEATTVIGYRLHSCIPSVGMGIPIVPIIADGRSMAFVETFELSELSVNPMEPFAEQHIYNLIIQGLNSKNQLWQHMIEKREFYRIQMNQFLRNCLDKV